MELFFLHNFPPLCCFFLLCTFFFVCLYTVHLMATSAQFSLTRAGKKLIKFCRCRMNEECFTINHKFFSEKFKGSGSKNRRKNGFSVNPLLRYNMLPDVLLHKSRKHTQCVRLDILPIFSCPLFDTFFYCDSWFLRFFSVFILVIF